MKRASIAAAALAAVVVLTSSAGARAEEVMHYLRTYHGQVIGIRRVAVREDDGRVHIETVDQTRISTRGVVVTTVTERVELTDLDGYGLELRERQTEGAAAEAILRRGGAPFEFTPRASRGSQVVDLDVTVSEDEVVFRTTLARQERIARGEKAGPVRFELDGRAFARGGGFEVGKTVRDYVVARVELGIAELEARVLERVELPRIDGVYSGGEEGYLIRIANAGGQGEPWEIVSDARGRTVELRMGPILHRRVAPADAVMPPRAPVLSNTFPTRRVSRLEGVRSLKVEATVAEGVRDDVFPESFYCKASRGAAGGFVLSLAEARPDGRLPRTELTDDDRKRFLAPSRLVQSDAPEIVRLASRILRGDEAALGMDLDALLRGSRAGPGPDEATSRESPPGPLRVRGGEKDPLKRALFLTRWVYRGLRKRSRGPATASALEALRAKAGDCTEHAALVTALARAAGLPARQAYGLVQDGEGFQFHAWAEAYVEDRWVPLDPTLGRVGVPALYVLLGREGDVIEYHCRANALQGRTSMRLVEIN